LRALKEKKVIVNELGNSKRCHLNFTNNFLIRIVIKKLEEEEEEGFIPHENRRIETQYRTTAPDSHASLEKTYKK
tara:strand:- start:1485 stop:1709 length:225 start_codon:yes stop_codon:yes gene_type:complete